MSAPVVERAERGTGAASEMRGLVVAEFRKTLAGSVWWMLLIPGILMAVILLLSEVRKENVALSLASALAWSSMWALLFGVVSASAEYRHNTIPTSYLIAANRPKLIVAKSICAAVVGATHGLICAAGAAAAVPISGTGYGNEGPAILPVSGGAAVAYALWAVLGVGVGTLLRNQVLAVIAAPLYLVMIEPIVRVGLAGAGLSRLSQYLPDRSATLLIYGLTGGPRLGGQVGVTTPWWLSLLVASGYAAMFIAAGIAVAQRRDIG
jgi:hypothetical protein